MTGWEADRPLPRWPRRGADEPPQLWSADFQEWDGSWTNIVSDTSLREAIAAARRVRAQMPEIETRVR